MTRPARRLLPASLALAGAAGLALLVAPSAEAATTRTTCDDRPDARACYGVQTSGGDIRGYASVTRKPAGNLARVTVRTVELQRRTCGGAWHSWTTKQDPDWSTGTDTAATQYVQFPSRVQFRTKTLVAFEGYTAFNKTYTSKVFGSC